jgi:hypothetical protein
VVAIVCLVETSATAQYVNGLPVDFTNTTTRPIVLRGEDSGCTNPGASPVGSQQTSGPAAASCFVDASQTTPPSTYFTPVNDLVGTLTWRSDISSTTWEISIDPTTWGKVLSAKLGLEDVTLSTNTDFELLFDTNSGSVTPNSTNGNYWQATAMLGGAVPLTISGVNDPSDLPFFGTPQNPGFTSPPSPPANYPYYPPLAYSCQWASLIQTTQYGPGYPGATVCNTSSYVTQPGFIKSGGSFPGEALTFYEAVPITVTANNTLITNATWQAISWQLKEFAAGHSTCYGGTIQNCVDSDADGVPDELDNCPYTANGALLGTCLGKSSQGQATCHANSDCVSGKCSLSQEDTGGIGLGSSPDGIGDACQCGDVDNDGFVTNADHTILSRSLVGLPPYGTAAAMPGYLKCDVNADGNCNSPDLTIIGRVIVGITPPFIKNGNTVGTGCPAAIPPVRPSTYDAYDTSVAPNDGSALQKLLQQNTAPQFIYIQPGQYGVTCPITINRSTTLYLEGVDRINTIIYCTNPSPGAALFSVTAATIVRFAGIDLEPNLTAQSTTMMRALLATNSTSDKVTLEVMDTLFAGGAFELDGPVQATFQGDTCGPGGLLDACILENDPGADVLVMGGDWSNGSSALTANIVDSAMIWQKQGRLRVYNQATEGLLGNGAYRVESSSSLGPHVFGNNRTEGNDGAQLGTGVISRLVYVPSTANAVNIVLKANALSSIAGPALMTLSNVSGSFTARSSLSFSPSGATATVISWNPASSQLNILGANGTLPLANDTVTQTTPSASGTMNGWVASAWNNCELVNYNGAGTVWLIGNTNYICGSVLVNGTAPNATIVSIGNLTTGPAPLPVAATGARVVTAEDGYWYFIGSYTLLGGNLSSNDGHCTNSSGSGQCIYWNPGGPSGTTPSLASYGSIPQPPDDSIPQPLSRPTMRAALPGMVDVKQTYNAKGDGTTDDTTAIQNAFNALCAGSTNNPPRLYFPAGTYRITATLNDYSHLGGTCSPAAVVGGFIAGAGSGVTKIVADDSLKIGTFRSDSMGYMTIMGLSFKTWAWGTQNVYRYTATYSSTAPTVTLSPQPIFNSPALSLTSANVGWFVTGDGIPPGTRIASVQSATQFTLSANPGSPCSGTCLVGNSPPAITITADPQNANFDAEMNIGNTQQMTFYDTNFDGGFGAYATGIHWPTGGNCSSETHFYSTFQNAYLGYMQGHANVILDGGEGLTFSNNQSAFGLYVDNSLLGTATFPWAMHATDTGASSTYQDAPFYAYDYTTNAPVQMNTGGTGNPVIQLIEDSNFSPSGSGPVWSTGGFGGPIFLYSTVSRSAIWVQGSGFAQSYALKLASTITDWSSATHTAPSGVVDSEW